MAKKPALISDQAVAAKTGKVWAEWFDILDAAGAKKMNHKQIVAHLAERYNVPPWWRQMVTVTYEQQRGGRKLHQRPEGFQISVSKTIAAPPAALYKAWADARIRRRWMPDAQLAISTATPSKSLRSRWGQDGGRLDVDFYPKGDDKTQVTVQHSQLPNARAAERMKKFWKERLEALKALSEK